MEQNYYFQNMLPLRREVSEITNMAIPLNVLQVQTIPMQINSFVSTQGMPLNDYAGFCTSLNKCTSSSSMMPVSVISQKENIDFGSPKLYNHSKSEKTTPIHPEILNAENVSTTNASRSNEATSDLKKKEKSLSELTKNFMKKYGNKEDVIIPLDKCTIYLNTEKRRVYDIMNIFEGFGAVSRKAKNMYSWKGLTQIAQALQSIEDRCSLIKDQHSPELLEDENAIDTTLIQYKFERVKSLGFLCEAFICLFILWKPIISLEEAAKKISKILLNDSQLKTKVRRLYDIANVLCVLRIVKKTLLKTGKPAFQWIGTAGIEEFSQIVEEEHSSGDESLVKRNLMGDSKKIARSSPDLRNNTISHNPLSLFNDRLKPVNMDSIVNTLPLGLNEESLDVLEGIIRVLRKRLQDQKLNAAHNLACLRKE